MTFTITVGSARVDQVTELERWPFPPADLYPAIADDVAAGVLDELGAVHVDPETGDLLLAIHVYVLRLGGRTIVVDTGNGNAKERPVLLPHDGFDTDFLARLAKAGVDPSDVDLVVSTHLHPDHCGWNTRLVDGAWRPTFPHATYLLAADDLAHLHTLADEDPAEGVESDFVRMFHDSVRPVLEESDWREVVDGEVLAEADGTKVVVRLAPGHTAGHLVVEIESLDGGAVVSGDVIHHLVQVGHPDLCQGGDADPALARATRDALLRRCAGDGLLLLPAHVPVDAPLTVELDADDHPRLVVRR